MAERKSTFTVDDLDPTGETLASDTVRFHDLDGNEREIDLCAENITGLKAAQEAATEILDRFVKASRVVKKAAAGPTRHARRVNSALCRRWLREVKGYGFAKLPERGRIPQDLVEEYLAAGSPKTW